MGEPDDKKKTVKGSSGMVWNLSAKPFDPTAALGFIKTADLGQPEGKAKDALPTPPKPSEKVEKVKALPADEKATTAINAEFAANAADPEFAKAATTKLGEITGAIKALGRSKPTKQSEQAAWNAEVKKIRAGRKGTEDLRKSIKAELAKPDLDAEVAKELQAMKAAVDAALLEIVDIEPAHGPTNHVKISRDGAGKRALLGINPRNGKPKDRAANATKFKNPSDFLDAMELGRNDAKFATETAAAIDLTDPDNPVIKKDYITFTLPLKDVLGTDYESKLEGQTVVGSSNNRKQLKKDMKKADKTDADALLSTMGVAPTNLKNGVMHFGFEYIDGIWELSTMYPEVEQDSHGNPKNARPANPELKYDRAHDRWLKLKPGDASAKPPVPDVWAPYDPDEDKWL